MAVNNKTANSKTGIGVLVHASIPEYLYVYKCKS